jgi:hypothetical protein
MEFLYGLLDHQKATLMGSSNLAIVFAPNLLRSKSGDIAVEIQDTPYCNGVCQYLIENYHAVFDSVRLITLSSVVPKLTFVEGGTKAQGKGCCACCCGSNATYQA